MFGYVRPSEARLSEADKERFAAAYCGLCRTLGERYGLVPRLQCRPGQEPGKGVRGLVQGGAPALLQRRAWWSPWTTPSA